MLNWIKSLLARVFPSKAVVPSPVVTLPQGANPSALDDEYKTYLENFNKALLHLVPIPIGVCDLIVKNKSLYMEVQIETNVPWWFVGAIHYREASFNFNSCLHNGDPWNKVTTHVPRGLGPWKSWQEAAINAFQYDKLSGLPTWSIGEALYRAEKYNGMGYRNRGFMSPYVWSGTTLYKSGLFVSDGRFDQNAIDKRPGVATILKYMIAHDLVKI